MHVITNVATTIGTRSLLVLLVGLAAVFSVVEAADSPVWSTTTKTPFTPNNDWLGTIGDSVPVSSLLIPGSHSSCVVYSGGKDITFQSYTLEEQLELGLRFFDVELSWANPDNGEITGLFVTHNSALVRPVLEVSELLHKFVNYLTNHPSEFILLHLYKSSITLDTPFQIGMEGVFYDSIITSHVLGFEQPLKTTAPLVGSARGKIVMFNGDDFTFLTWGFQYPSKFSDNGFVENSLFSVEDYITHIQPDVKYLHSISHLGLTTTLWKVTVLSSLITSGCIANGLCVKNDGDVAQFADLVNTKLSSDLPQNASGVIAIDFPGPSLVDLIIETNKKHQSINHLDNDNQVGYPHTPQRDLPPVPRWVVGVICGILGTLLIVFVLLYIYRDHLKKEEEEESSREDKKGDDYFHLE